MSSLNCSPPFFSSSSSSSSFFEIGQPWQAQNSLCRLALNSQRFAGLVLGLKVWATMLGFPHYFSRQGLLLNPELSDQLDCLSSVPWACLQLFTPRVMGRTPHCMAFYIGSWDLSSGLHACITGTFPSEPSSPQAWLCLLTQNPVLPRKGKKSLDSESECKCGQANMWLQIQQEMCFLFVVEDEPQLPTHPTSNPS